MKVEKLTIGQTFSGLHSTIIFGSHKFTLLHICIKFLKRPEAIKPKSIENQEFGLVRRKPHLDHLLSDAK